MVACGFCGISERVFYAWMREADETDARPRVAQFVQSVREARSFAEAAAVQIVQRAARNGDWRASAWFLEHSAPGRWGKQHRVEIDVHSVDQPRVGVRKQLELAMAQLGEDLREFNQVIESTIAPEPLPASILPFVRPEIV